MARRPRSRPTPQLALEWTESLRRDVRDELRERLSELLAHLVDPGRRADGAPR